MTRKPPMQQVLATTADEAMSSGDAGLLDRSVQASVEDGVTIPRSAVVHAGLESDPPPIKIAAEAIRMRLGNSAEALLFNYVFNHGAPKDRHLASFFKVLNGAISLGHHAWPLEMKALVWGKDVLDFGCGATLFGPVIRAVGARSYAGIDKAIDPTRKRFRSNILKQTVSLNFSMADAARVFSNMTYMQADDVISREAFDIALMQSVTHQLMDPDKTFRNIHRSLRDRGQIWLLHDNFYAWAGHQQMPKSLSSYDSNNPAHQMLVDWGHINYQPDENHPFRALNRLRLGELRAVLDRYFRIDDWKEIPDKPAIAARLTPEVRVRIGPFHERELLTRQVVIRGTKRALEGA